jgi:hypothetical protein
MELQVLYPFITTMGQFLPAYFVAKATPFAYVPARYAGGSAPAGGGQKSEEQTHG